MAREHEPMDVLLEIGMHEAVMSFASSSEPLDDETIQAAETVIAKDGLGITNLSTHNKRVFYVEYGSLSSPAKIVRTLGYLAAQKIDRPIHFIRPDGTEHSIQLEQD